MMEEDYRNLADKFHRREDLVCKIFDGVKAWTGGGCMYDMQFLLMLTMMDEEALRRFLDNEDWKTHFKKHKKKHANA